MTVALVTGGSGGIGAAVCRLLAADGHDVALTYRRRRPDELIHDLEAVGRLSSAIQLDLGHPDDVAAVVEEVTGAGGALDVLVHAAGPHVPMVHLSAVSPERFRTQLVEDAAGFFNLMSAALPALRVARGAVAVVTTAATERFPVRDGLSAGPKGAVHALVRGFAAEEGRYGVRVNAVAPGMLTDGMAARLIADGDLDERALEVTRANIPLRTFGTALDVAEATRFLVSPRAGFITGQVLCVDGGYSV